MRWWALAVAEIRLALANWPFRITLMGVALWPLIATALSSSRPEFQGQALRESFGTLGTYVFPLMAAGLGSAALQSGMIRSILTSQLSRSGLLGARLFGRSVLLALAIALGLSGTLLAAAFYNAESPTKQESIEGVTVLSSSSYSHAGHDQLIVNLAWRGSDPSNIDLKLPLAKGESSTTFILPFLTAIQTSSTSHAESRDWIQVSALDEAGAEHPIEGLETTQAQASFRVPKAAEKDGFVVIRLAPAKGKRALIINLREIRRVKGETSLLPSLLIVALRALLLSFVFLSIGIAASSRFSQSSSLVVSAGLFFLCFFVSSVAIGQDQVLGASAESTLGTESPSQREPRFQPDDFLPNVQVSREQEAFERQNIALSGDSAFDLNLATLILVIISLGLALVLLQDRDFLGEEAHAGS